MRQPHVHAELIKKWADGYTIQWWSAAHKEWLDTHCPSWGNECMQYRVKPEPVTRYYCHTAQDFYETSEISNAHLALSFDGKDLVAAHVLKPTKT